MSLLLLNFRRKERVDVFASTQFKLQQNARYKKNITIEELDKLQHTKPELSEFIWLFFGIDRSDYTEDQILELNDRLESLPDRLKIAKAKRPNLAKITLSDIVNHGHGRRKDIQAVLSSSQTTDY